MNISSPAPWMGGKQRQAPLIIEHLMQARHTHYVEVFGGGASVLIRKPPSDLETFNDRDRELVNFWMHVRDNPQILQDALDSLPYSRAIYEEWRDASEKDSLTPLERAVRFYYILRAAFGSQIKGKPWWSWTTVPAASKPRSMRSATALLGEVSKRMRYVQIDCKDWRDILVNYDSADTLFYLDPPYFSEGNKYYRGESWVESDHQDLAERLSAIRGKAAVSYHAHPIVDALYSGWRRVEYEYMQYGPNSRTAERNTHTEILLLNYEAHEARVVQQNLFT